MAGETAAQSLRAVDSGAPASANRWRRSCGSSRSVPAIAPSTCSDALMSRPCSSQVYQVTPTPASCATSSRRRPGVRRRPAIGSPTCSGGDPLAPAAQEPGQLLAADGVAARA